MLFRRRQIWWPTWRGWLLLFALLALAVVVWAHTIVGFLAMNQPARQASTLVVEGWMNEADLAQAITAFQRGGYTRLLTTGGPIDPWSDVGHWKTFAVRGAAYALAHGVAQDRVVPLSAPESLQERTWTNALMVRDWAARSGTALGGVDVYTAGMHARRSHALYARALGEKVEVGVLAAVPNEFDTLHWWRSSAGAKAVLGESLSWLWTSCCFWPDPKVTVLENRGPAL